MNRRSFALGLALATSAGCAPDTSPPPAAEAHGLVAARVRDEMYARRSGMGLRPEFGFAMARASDGRKGPHRVGQLYRGLPVFEGSVIVRSDPEGRVESAIEWLHKDIDLDPTPRLSEAAAREIAERELGIGEPLTTKAELGIHTERQLVVKRTGLPPGEADRALNADEIDKRVVGHRLAWRVEVSPSDPTSAHEGFEYTIDATSGVILRRVSLSSHATGWSQYSGLVSLQTTDLGGLSMCGRRYVMLDNTRGGSYVALHYSGSLMEDIDNLWGDGNPPSEVYGIEGLCDAKQFSQNSQTAAVDALHGFSVGWDMYKRVFGQLGWNHFGTGVPIYVHSQKPSSQFERATMSIHFVDGQFGTPHNDIDSVVHEFTHGVDYQLGSMTNELKEGLADIFGTLGKIYWNEGSTSAGYRAQSTTIPDNARLVDFHMFESLNDADSRGRYLYQPSRTGGPDFYFPTIEGVEEHLAGQPLGRAFYFLSEGASPHVDWDTKASYRSQTSFLTWGMPGVGADRAGRIFYDAFFECMGWGAGYSTARWCAELVSLSNSTWNTAVKNAFAGINVGALAAGYPADPPAPLEDEDNQHAESAMLLSWTAPPPAPFEPVWKTWVRGAVTSTTDQDTFEVRVKCGRMLGVQLSPPPGVDLDLFFYDRNEVLQEYSQNLVDESERLSFDSRGTCTTGDTISFYVKVKGWQGAHGSARYKLMIDTYWP